MNINVPCKVWCKKSQESTFIIGRVYQIRFEPRDEKIFIDKDGRGGIEQVPSNQFEDHFEVVIQVVCKKNLEKGTALFEKNGKYWAATDGKGHKIFTGDGIKEVSVGSKIFSEHFCPYGP